MTNPTLVVSGFSICSNRRDFSALNRNSAIRNVPIPFKFAKVDLSCNVWTSLYLILCLVLYFTMP